MKIFRNIMAVIAGIVIGSLVNMGILEVGPFIIPNPEGFDNSTMEKLAETIQLLTPIHFITVFLSPWLRNLNRCFYCGKNSRNKTTGFCFCIRRMVPFRRNINDIYDSFSYLVHHS